MDDLYKMIDVDPMMDGLIKGVAQARKDYANTSLGFDVFMIVFGLAMMIGSITLMAVLAADGKAGYIALFLPLALFCCALSCGGCGKISSIR